MKFKLEVNVLVIVGSFLLCLPMVKAEGSGSEPVEPMFESGKFKCSDGYDPDTDASLHPPGQSPRAREIVNAQAQEAHEKETTEKGEKKDKTDGKSLESKTESESSSKDLDIQKDEANKAELKDTKEKSDETKEAVDKKENKEEKDKKENLVDKKKENSSDKQAEKQEKNKEEEKDKDSRSSTFDKNLPKVVSSPLQQANFAIQCGNYKESMTILKNILSKEASNAQVYYMLAVSYVGMRNYVDARDCYQKTLRLSKNTKLVQLANLGLEKLSTKH